MGGGRCAAARDVISCSLAKKHQSVEASAKNSKTQAVDSAASVRSTWPTFVKH